MMIYIGIARHERIQMVGEPMVGVARKRSRSEVEVFLRRAKTETNEADVWDLSEITRPMFVQRREPSVNETPIFSALAGITRANSILYRDELNESEAGQILLHRSAEKISYIIEMNGERERERVYVE